MSTEHRRSYLMGKQVELGHDIDTLHNQVFGDRPMMEELRTRHELMNIQLLLLDILDALNKP